MREHDPAIHNVVVMGASAGGVMAILDLAKRLPADFPTPILLVQHIGTHESRLHQLIAASGPNPSRMPEDGEPLRRGTIYVAPPDRHMLLEEGRVRLSRGPKENHARPAIDPLFRSAALSYGRRAIGVVLTGRLDDGSAGLRAIKDCGGAAVVQDPNDALEPSMPSSALAVVDDVDHVVTLERMPSVLQALALQLRGNTVGVPEALRREHAIATHTMGGDTVEVLKTIGRPSAFTCPDCGGALFELDDGKLLRYRCHTGHGLTLRSLAASQEEVTDTALWTALRSLQEKEAILRRVADRVQGADADSATREADQLALLCVGMRRVLGKAPSPASFE
jgi:two-component system chemotaxis response regulator CheB